MNNEELRDLMEKGKHVFDALSEGDKETVLLYIDDHLKTDDYFRDEAEVIADDAITDLAEIIADKLPGFTLDACLLALKYAVNYLQRSRAARILKEIYEPDDDKT